MNPRETRHRSAPAFAWLLLGVIALVLFVIGFLGLLVWHQNQQVMALRADLAELRDASEARLAALGGTAEALEKRLGVVEANDPAQQLAALQSAADLANSPQQIADLRASLADFQIAMNQVQDGLDDVAARLESLESGGDDPETVLPPELRLPVPRYQQSHNLSCESSAASMAANYLGVPLSEAEVLAALPLNANPHLGFRGSVDGPTGSLEDYGVYAKPIQDVLGDRGLRTELVEGGLPGIKSAVARGNPVIAWITYDCQPRTPTTVTIDGQPVTLVPYQHAVVITGYNSEGVWANDPWDGLEDFYSEADLERALSYFDNMAIEVSLP
jgi:uncharacterized protein YvpB